MGNIEKEIIRKASSEGKSIRNRPRFSNFKKLFGAWFFGGVLAVVPIFVSLLQSPASKVTLWQFFSDIEMVYVCVTMSIVLICDLVLRKINLLFFLNLLTITFGTLIYGQLKSGATMPIFDIDNNFPIFNIIFLLFVFLMGIISYITISFSKEGA